jgi:uncharacterized protein (UPF0303 family)
MEGWGSLTMLIKRQEAAKNRKTSLKFELQKRRESLFKDNVRQKLEFPEISNADMKILKEEIRKKYRTEKTKNIIINIIIFTFVLFLFYYIFRTIKLSF